MTLCQLPRGNDTSPPSTHILHLALATYYLHMAASVRIMKILAIRWKTPVVASRLPLQRRNVENRSHRCNRDKSFLRGSIQRTFLFCYIFTLHVR